MAGPAFFAKLPPGKLTPAEADLRGLLLKAAAAAKLLLPQAVSLQEWVERRMPGEVSLSTDVLGRVTMLPQARKAELDKSAPAVKTTPKAPPAGKPPPADAQAFFAGLPSDSFTAEEEKLRAAITACLPPKGPTPVAQVLKEPQVSAAARACLPRSVPLHEWVERRIGGEVLVSEDEGSGRMLRLAPGGKQEQRDAFFAALPMNSFTPDEERLRAALFDFLATWKSKELANLSHVGGDKAVREARTGFLPAVVNLREWIERRIGGEVELRLDHKGQYAVHLTPAARPLVMRRFQELGGGAPGVAAVPGAPGRGGRGGPGGPGGPAAPAALGGPAAPAGPGSAEVSQEARDAAREEFFEGLPADELLPQELDLRQALIDFIEVWTGKTGGQDPVLSDAGQDKAIQRCRAALLPPGTSLQSWIERRIGGEIETRQHPNGQLALGLPRGRRARANRGAGRAGRNGGTDEAPQVPAPDGGDASLGERREAFFEQLPPDGFTQEEEQLREALMGFLGDWQAPEPPTLSTAGSDPRVRDARAAFLPKGCGASLKEWIDRRIGGEIETTVPESKGMEVAIGFRGQLDHAAAARALRKRKADSGKGGPGGAGGGGKAGKGRRTGP